MMLCITGKLTPFCLQDERFWVHLVTAMPLKYALGVFSEQELLLMVARGLQTFAGVSLGFTLLCFSTLCLCSDITQPTTFGFATVESGGGGSQK